VHNFAVLCYDTSPDVSIILSEFCSSIDAYISFSISRSDVQSPAGTASNFLYTSPASSNKTYFGQTKKTTGIGFGGEVGKERLWIDEDFTSVTVRHHAVDKTYEYGHLLPEQVSIFLCSVFSVSICTKQVQSKRVD
jgi:hypothetical protein